MGFNLFNWIFFCQVSIFGYVIFINDLSILKGVLHTSNELHILWGLKSKCWRRSRHVSNQLFYIFVNFLVCERISCDGCCCSACGLFFHFYWQSQIWWCGNAICSIVKYLEYVQNGAHFEFNCLVDRAAYMHTYRFHCAVLCSALREKVANAYDWNVDRGERTGKRLKARKRKCQHW